MYLPVKLTSLGALCPALGWLLGAACGQDVEDGDAEGALSWEPASLPSQASLPLIPASGTSVPSPRFPVHPVPSTPGTPLGSTTTTGSFPLPVLPRQSASKAALCPPLFFFPKNVFLINFIIKPKLNSCKQQQQEIIKEKKNSQLQEVLTPAPFSPAQGRVPSPLTPKTQPPPTPASNLSIVGKTQRNFLANPILCLNGTLWTLWPFFLFVTTNSAINFLLHIF